MVIEARRWPRLSTLFEESPLRDTVGFVEHFAIAD
jgi:hypothetical protein